MKIHLNIKSKVFVKGYQYVGGSALKVGQLIERNGLTQLVTECHGLSTNGDYEYTVSKA